MPVPDAAERSVSDSTTASTQAVPVKICTVTPAAACTRRTLAAVTPLMTRTSVSPETVEASVTTSRPSFAVAEVKL